MSKRLNDFAALILAGRGRSGSGYLKLTTFWAYWAVSRKPVLLFRPCGAVENTGAWCLLGQSESGPCGIAPIWKNLAGDPTAFLFLQHGARPEPMDFGLLSGSYILRHRPGSGGHSLHSMLRLGNRSRHPAPTSALSIFCYMLNRSRKVEDGTGDEVNITRAVCTCSGNAVKSSLPSTDIYHLLTASPTVGRFFGSCRQRLDSRSRS